jgi:hypothetical protein
LFSPALYIFARCSLFFSRLFPSSILAHSGPLYIFALLYIALLCLFVYFGPFGFWLSLLLLFGLTLYIFAALLFYHIPHSSILALLHTLRPLRFIPISLALLLCITQYFTHSAPISLALLLLSVLAFVSFHSARSTPIYPLRSLFSVLYLLSLTYSSYLIFLLEFISFFSAPAYSTRFAFLYAFIPALILALLLL